MGLTLLIEDRSPADPLLIDPPHQPVAAQTQPDTSDAIPDVRPSLPETEAQTSFGRIATIVSEAQTLDIEHLKQKVLSMASDCRDGVQWHNEHLFRIYIDRMVELDPPETLAFLNSTRDFARLRYHAFCDWSKDALDEAIQYYLSEQSLWEAPHTSYWRCLVQHPEIEAHPDVGTLSELIGKEFEDQLKVERLSKLPPREAFELAQSLERNQRREAASKAAKRWAEEDLIGFLQYLSDSRESIAIDSSLIRNALLDPLRENPLLTLRLINDYLELDQNTTLNLLVNTAINLPFREAREFLDAYRAESDDSNMTSTLAASLFRANPEQALEYFDSFSEMERVSIYVQMSHHFAELSPDEALSWALALDTQFSSAKSNVFKDIARQDWESLEQEFQRSRDGVNRRSMFVALGESMARKDPERAFRWAENHRSEPGYGEVANRIFREWARKDPWAVGDYVKDTLVADQPVPSMSQVMWAMMMSDLPRARLYVDELPDSIVKQQAISGMASVIAYTDPREAYRMVQDLESKQIRGDAVRQIANKWASREPASVNEIAEYLELSAEQAAYLRARYVGTSE